MKNITLFIIILFITTTIGCKSNEQKITNSIEKYLKANLRNYSNYEALTFSSIDTLKYADTTDGKISLYSVKHVYYIINNDKEKVKTKITFYLDKKLEITKIGYDKNINGDYGSLTGNVYWKYNNFVGNKPDAGSNILLISTDTTMSENKFETTCDVMGNFKIEKIPSGRYFIIVTSKNTKDSPIGHIRNLIIYQDDIKNIFGFDISNFKNELSEIKKIDSLFKNNITIFNSNWSLVEMQQNIDYSNKLEKELIDKSEKLINLFSKDFKLKIKLYTPYSYSYDFGIINIEGNKTTNEVVDFGTTYL